MITETTQEIEQYAAAVRTALADLPDEVRNELLEDLPDHLAEVAAEAGGMTLVERLGTPEQYAAELRATLPGGGASGSQQRWSATVGRVRLRLISADTKVGRMIGYGRFTEFGRLLRPAWWVLRGYVAGLVLMALASNEGQRSLIPGDSPLGLIVTVGLIVGSIWLGRRTGQMGRWTRRLVTAASIVLAVVGVVGFAQMDSYLREGTQVVYQTGSEFDQVQDIYAYDPSGKLLTNVRLFDQNGNPITVGYARCDTPILTDTTTRIWELQQQGMDPYAWKQFQAAYPYCTQYAPALQIGPLPTAAPAIVNPSSVASPNPVVTGTPIPTPTS